MMDNNSKNQKAPAIQLPTAKRTQARLLRAWIIGVTVFGYGPAFTYGHLAWLFNEEQWRLTYLLYLTEVPLVGGFFVLWLPWFWYRPIHRAILQWSSGEPIDRALCAAIYEKALYLPWRIALACITAATLGYVTGLSTLHLLVNQPWIEIAKTFPAIPLVGGMMGAFCYFATVRALHPVLAWCSSQLRFARPMRRVSIAEKFLTTTIVLVIATLCLLQPAGYTLGQVVTERHLQERATEHIDNLAYRISLFKRPEEQADLIGKSSIGSRGYTFIIDRSGKILTAHPKGYTDIAQENLYKFWDKVQGADSHWVDRVGQHRVIAATLLPGEPDKRLVMITYPGDFSLPIEHFMQFTMIALVEVVFVLFLFGRYFTRGITAPLAELTAAAQHIAEQGDFSLHVPVTSNDELGEVAIAFNRMVEQVNTSQTVLREHAKRLERSTEALSAVNLEMEDLLRVVSHDLRAPLINIQGFSKRLEPLMQQTFLALDSLAAKHPDAGLAKEVQALKSQMETRFAESLRFISKGVEKMDTLLASLLAVSRVGRKADPMQPNDLNAIVGDVLETFDHQLKERAIEVIRHPLPSGVPCRRNEINQVFSNLVSNAIKYMGAGEQRFIEIGANTQIDHVACYVRDTGIGINPEDQPRIFQMFTRLQAIEAPGEGVGLAYTKKILRSHGGQIWVTSQRGQGSTFFFTLPKEQNEAISRG